MFVWTHTSNNLWRGNFTKNMLYLPGVGRSYVFFHATELIPPHSQCPAPRSHTHADGVPTLWLWTVSSELSLFCKMGMIIPVIPVFQWCWEDQKKWFHDSAWKKKNHNIKGPLLECYSNFSIELNVCEVLKTLYERTLGVAWRWHWADFLTFFNPSHSSAFWFKEVFWAVFQMLPDVVPPSRPVFIILILLSVESWTPCCTLCRLVPQSSLPVVMGNSLELQTHNCGNWCWEQEGEGVMLRAIGHWAGSTLKGAKFLVFHIFHMIPRKLCVSFSFRPDWQILKTMVNHLFMLILNFQGKYLSIFWGLGAEFWGQNKSLPSELSTLGRPHDVTVNGGTPNTLTAMGMWGAGLGNP